MFACVCELVFESLHAVDTSTNRKSMTKQRDKACKQDINRIPIIRFELAFCNWIVWVLNPSNSAF